MGIPDHKIAEIRSASDIVEIASDYLEVKPSGSRFKALCPFHDEKTPSFSLDPNQNLYYCFGCKRGGDVFSFLQEMESVTFVESARMLADRFGISLPQSEEHPEEASETESIHFALRFAARFFYKQLQSERGEPARAYLAQRGLEDSTVKAFGIGYAPGGWSNLLEAAEEVQLKAELLEKAGLVLPRKQSDGYYDRFRHRLIFPILSHIGKVLGFGGRILDPESDQPKYINSPETKVYDKSTVLYGLYQSKQAIRSVDEVYIVEGYTDVTSLHQSGVQNVVASSGTALTEKQVKLLDRYAKRVILLYDADEAGRTAARRAVDLVLAQGMTPYVVSLPDGEDPDTYVSRVGADAFREYAAEHRRDFELFLWEAAEASGELETPEGRAEAMREILRTITRDPDGLRQEQYVRRLGDLTEMPLGRLHEELQRLQYERRRQEERRAYRERQRAQRQQKQRQQTQDEDPHGMPPMAPVDARADGGMRPVEPGAPGAPREAEEAAPQQPSALPPEKALLRLMLEEGLALVEYVLGTISLEEFSEGPARQVATKLVEQYEEEEIDLSAFLGVEADRSVRRFVTGLMLNEYEPSANWITRDIRVPRFNSEPKLAARKAMINLRERRVAELIDQVRRRIRSGEEDESALLAELQDLLALKQAVKEGAFIEADDAS